MTLGAAGVANVSVNPGSSTRFIWYADVADGTYGKVYMDEKTYVAPQNVASAILELPSRTIGGVTVQLRKAGTAQTYFSLGASEENTEYSLYLKENVTRASFSHPIVVVGYNTSEYDSVMLGNIDASSGFTPCTVVAVPTRLSNGATERLQYYQKAYDCGITSLDNFAFKELAVKLKAKPAAALVAGSNTTAINFNVVDKANYLARDGTTVYSDVETTNANSVAEIAASAADTVASYCQGSACA